MDYIVHAGGQAGYSIGTNSREAVDNSFMPTDIDILKLILILHQTVNWYASMTGIRTISRWEKLRARH